MDNTRKLDSHIQSLRAFSVILVFLFHTKIELFSYGYLGVDIFFLISGYVISKNIFENFKETKSVNLINFYRKRIKRILPNLFIIVSVVYIFVKFFGPPTLPIFNEALYAYLGLSNFYYLTYSKDYFNNFDDPLGHTWSLGVEEQFYLIFPIIIYLCFKLKNNNNLILFISLILIFLLSIACFVLFYQANPLYSFYFSPFRFWEFLIGTFFFISKERIIYNHLIFKICIILILIIVFFDQYILINAYKNIFVLILTGYVIASYKKNIIFENKIIIYLGNISYSFYLWHLPILFFSNLYFSTNIYISSILSLLLTLSLSSITYKYVEQKFRYKTWNSSYLIVLALIAVICSSFLFYIKFSNVKIHSNVSGYINSLNYIENEFNWIEKTGFEKKLNIENNLVYEFCLENSKDFTINKIGLRNECLKTTDNSEIFFLFGDSHSVQFLPLLTESKLIKNIYYNHLRGHAFPPIETINILKNNYEKVYLLTNIQELKDLEYVKESYDKLEFKDVKLILFNSTPSPNWKSIFVCLVQNKDCYIQKNKDINKRNLNKQLSLMNEYQKNNSDIFIFKSLDYLCNKNNECPVYKKSDDILFYRDNSHLTYNGAISLLNNFETFIKESKFIREVLF